MRVSPAGEKLVASRKLKLSVISTVKPTGCANGDKLKRLPPKSVDMTVADVPCTETNAYASVT